MTVSETVKSPAPIEQEELTSDYYRDVIKEAYGRTFAPENPEQAAHLINEALDVYRNLPPPRVNLPDTPEPTLKQLVNERTYQYWQDRDEPVPTHDDSPAGVALKIIASQPGLPEDAPGELLMWAAAKAVLANNVWQSVVFSKKYREHKLPPEITEDEWRDLIPIMSGRLKVVIKNGVPTIEVHDYGAASKELFLAVEARKQEWVKDHKLLARSNRLCNVIPYLRDLMPILLKSDGRRGSKALSLFEAHALATYRMKMRQDEAAKAR